jgi:hypothetical protein
MQGILVEDVCVNPIRSPRANGLDQLGLRSLRAFDATTGVYNNPPKAKIILSFNHVLALDSEISWASISAFVFLPPPEACTTRVHTSSLACLC